MSYVQLCTSHEGKQGFTQPKQGWLPEDASLKIPSAEDGGTLQQWAAQVH